ncbi:MAG: SPASM domain-containing protein, partial [Deltaproteobacteria bacterium]|nr:SPASM domain-containing protein [Deltaproteobacteria bacterium]
RRNQHDIANTFKLAKSLKPAAWYMFMIVPTGRGEGLLEELISREDYDEILKWHFEQEIGETEILMRPTCAPHYYRIVPQMVKEQRLDFRRRDLTFSTGAGKGCVAAQTICLIDCFGDVKPCSYFDMSAGNVLRDKFGDIWFNSPLFRELRNFSGYKGRCGACEFLKVCGGCRARAYTVTGDYMEEEPFCNYVPLKMQTRNR